MTNKIALALIIGITFMGQIQAQQQVIGDDGRQILLNEDGSWQYRSTDRFATTADGRRVRLKDDGSWDYTGQKAVPAEQVVTAQPATGQKLLENQSVDIDIRKWVIERARSVEPRVKSRFSQTVFILTVTRQPDAGDTPLTLSASDFSISDSDDRQYDVISLTPDSLAINAGQTVELKLRGRGSPTRWSTKSMSVTVNKDAVDSPVDITLTRRMSTAKKVNVAGF